MNANVTSVRRKLADNLKRVRDRIEESCARAGRRPSDVTIVAVTKDVDFDVVRQTLDAGVIELGESRAQQFTQRAAMLHEFVTRRQRLGATPDKPAPRPRWHLIGHLQRNKVKSVLPWVDLVHSVDSLRLAEELGKAAEKLNRDVDYLMQVNTSGERSKFGVAVGAVSHMAEHLAKIPRLRLRGLMTMAPQDAAPDEVRLFFDRLRELAEDLRGEGLVGREFDQLSMGMSGDYPIAVEAGATLIRLGHALFEGLSIPADAPRTAESST